MKFGVAHLEEESENTSPHPGMQQFVNTIYLISTVFIASCRFHAKKLRFNPWPYKDRGYTGASTHNY